MHLYFTHIRKQKTKNFRSPTLIFWDMFLNGVSLNFCKKPRNIHFDLLFFHFPVKLVLPTYGPFSWSASHFLNLPISQNLSLLVTKSAFAVAGTKNSQFPRLRVFHCLYQLRRKTAISTIFLVATISIALNQIPTPVT